MAGLLGLTGVASSLYAAHVWLILRRGRGGLGSVGRAVLLVCVLFPLVGLAAVTSLPSIGTWGAALIGVWTPSAALAAIYWLGLRDWRPVVGVVLGAGAAPGAMIKFESMTHGSPWYIRSGGLVWLLMFVIGAAIWHAHSTVMLWWWCVRERRRMRTRGQRPCAQCGYDLSGVPTSVCPECGRNRNARVG
jgi:hypothetical protein